MMNDEMKYCYVLFKYCLTLQYDKTRAVCTFPHFGYML